jgi:oligoendopeptidase F
MLNYLGKERDVSTMAHELGHAIHAILSEKQTLFNYHSILPLAETASVFSEMIITDMVLKAETDPMAKQVILTSKLEDIMATSHRQNMFSNFEQLSHEAVAKGLVTTDQFCQLYVKGLDQMFGNSVVKWEWSTIPHIFESPFYVYAYNFGNLLVMALYQKYLEEGRRFVPKLKEMLAAGSSMAPIEICKIVGADITSESFWNKSFLYIESLVDQLESLVGDR